MNLKGSINVQKVDKAKLFRGKSGVYLNFVIYENDQPDQYGNTHVIKFDLSKEDRDAGEKPHIIGNAKTLECRSNQRPSPPQNNASKGDW